MSNTDVFNQNRRVDPVLGFNSNWNYSSPRKTGANYTTTRPPFGRWATRSIGNVGYSWDLTFVDRPIEQVRYIKSFYEQFQYGFFTLIDHDNGEREHVGRFTSYTDDTQTANLKYTIRVTFEEIPGTPMRRYPHDWLYSSHAIHVADDYMYPLAATSSAAWAQQNSPIARVPNTPASLEMYNATPAVGDFAQVEYIGWGCKTALRIAPSLGICNLFLDETEVVTGLDLSTGAATSVDATFNVLLELQNAANAEVIGEVVHVVIPNVSLGRHRFKLVATATKNASATSTAVLFASIRVMH